MPPYHSGNQWSSPKWPAIYRARPMYAASMDPICTVYGVWNSQIVIQALTTKSAGAAAAPFHFSLGIGKRGQTPFIMPQAAGRRFQREVRSPPSTLAIHAVSDPPG